MSQLSGAFTVEADLDRLAEVLASRVADRVETLLRERFGDPARLAREQHATPPTPPQAPPPPEGGWFAGQPDQEQQERGWSQ